MIDQEQYKAIKDRHPSEIVMMRGDNSTWWAFYVDADLVLSVLPSATMHKDPFGISFPNLRLDPVIKALLALGHRVSIAEPVEKADRPVERIVLRQGELY
jgi:DNA mismatch repair ATPase MutS